MCPHTMTDASYPNSFLSEHTSLTKNNHYKKNKKLSFLNILKIEKSKTAIFPDFAKK